MVHVARIRRVVQETPPLRRRLVAAALVLTVGLAVWVLAQPAAFRGYTGDAPYGFSPIELGQAIHIDTRAYPSVPVRLLSLRPLIAPGSPLTLTAVRVCPRGSTVGAVTDPADEHCADPREVRSGLPAVPFRLGEKLVFSVSSEQPGTVVIEGFELRYRRGLRVLRQRVGFHMEIPFAPGGLPGGQA